MGEHGKAIRTMRKHKDGYTHLDSEFLRGCLKKNKTSAIEVGTTLGKSHSWLSHCIAASYIPIEDGERLCELFDCSMNDLTGRTKVIEEYHESKDIEAEEAPIETTSAIIVPEETAQDRMTIRDIRKFVARKWIDGEESISVLELMGMLDKAGK